MPSSNTMIRLAVLLFFLTTTVPTLAQTPYWVYIQQRDEMPLISRVSPETYQNRVMQGLPQDQATDLRPSNQTIKAILKTGAELRYVSKWLGAISINADATQAELIKQLPNVVAVKPFYGAFRAANYGTASNESLYPAQDQMRTDVFINKGLTGKGIRMGLIDAGFRDADITPVLRHLYSRSAVKQVRDFVIPNRTPRFYRGPSDTLDTHGTTVLKMVAGYDSTKAKWLGCATGVDLYLARTDDAKHEYRAEEDQWLAAMEWMDSVGVRLINTSLGYGKAFDKESDNYTPAQIDGKTTAISKAASIAVNQKGLMVVVSAGNEGDDDSWHIIASPADVNGVLTVGATVGKPFKKASYSGVGPQQLAYVKPDVSAYSLTGTSFSAPAVAGFVACLMESNPTLSNKQLVEIMRRSSSLYPYINNYLGAGFPNAALALAAAGQVKGVVQRLSKESGKETSKDLIQNWDKDLQKVATISAKIQKQTRGKALIIDITNPDITSVVAFRKKDKYYVLTQEVLNVIGGKLTVDNTDKDVKFTTLMLLDQVLEVEWQ